MSPLDFLRRTRPQISLLVPFRADSNSPNRSDSWTWLRSYWRAQLPDAEIVIGISRSKIFSKTAAVNDAVSRSRGRILVILDSDCYIGADVVQACADNIDAAIAEGRRLWFIPFRHLYRLTEATTAQVIASDPADPYRLPSPPNRFQYESTLGSRHGHRYGAMIQIMPREAFNTVGAMDPRFEGWGGEDVAFVRAVDTLYQAHKTVENDVLHLWHPKIGVAHTDRQWANQTGPRLNDQLASRYNKATGDRVRMRALVNEGLVVVAQDMPWWRRVISWLT